MKCEGEGSKRAEPAALRFDSFTFILHNPPVRILGIDPGSVTTGFGVIDYERGRLTLVEQGSINTRRGAELSERLAVIHDGLREVIARTQPAAVAVETPFAGHNVKSLIQLAHARGVILLAARSGGAGGLRVLAALGQERGGRLRRRGEGAGREDGAHAAPGLRVAEDVGGRGGRAGHRHLPRAHGRHGRASETKSMSASLPQEQALETEAQAPPPPRGRLGAHVQRAALSRLPPAVARRVHCRRPARGCRPSRRAGSS